MNESSDLGLCGSLLDKYETVEWYNSSSLGDEKTELPGLGGSEEGGFGKT